MNNLKEIKFLDKINRITEKKIVKGNYVGNDNDLIDEEEIKLLEQQNIDIDQYIANKRKIKLRKERRKLKLDIENDKKEIINKCFFKMYYKLNIYIYFGSRPN
jgi:hypothetical protein